MRNGSPTTCTVYAISEIIMNSLVCYGMYQKDSEPQS